MNNQLNRLRELAIPLPIPPSYRQQAKMYALQYLNPNVQKRIYVQTLGLLAVDGYLRLLGFSTDLSKPQRWNAGCRLWSEANELELPGLGFLQCVVIGEGEEKVILTPKSTRVGLDFRVGLGYVFVEIADSEKTATLIGFLPGSELMDGEGEMEIAVATLKSVDDLIDFLSEREGLEVDELTQEFAVRKITYLQDWLNHIYEGEWEPCVRDLQAITCQRKFQLAERVLIVQLTVSENQDGSMFVRVIVQGENDYLPIGLQVSVPDESAIYTERVEEVADMIAIPLELNQGEEFWLELSIQGESVREYFVA
ncbi:DUF1822 family protein [Calothrix sp. NIES-3974]|uniref:DUF1822 family protein n=1 Tax=Calothrix sp. NIES-3974 TaxID=2005462 RepID=UPI000B616F87|nr:DUF1822 family protein [Calothrix sp. NIES-3974]BAZ04137.1 hypothetical protein NIES3974_07690 [Calothrix sp. NIES-3974]